MIDLLLFALGGCKMETKKTATKEEQIEFLKKNEEKMTKFVKAQNSKVDSVQYIWDTVKEETVGNGTPQGGGTILTMRISIFDNERKKINSFGFAVEPDEISNPNSIKRMYTINASYNYFERKE